MLPDISADFCWRMRGSPDIYLTRLGEKADIPIISVDPSTNLLNVKGTSR